MTMWEQKPLICSTSQAWRHQAMTNCHLPQWLDVSMATRVRLQRVWVSRDVTNALPTAGVGNDSNNAQTPKNHKEEGRVSKKVHEEKRKYRDDWRTSVKGTSCGWKTQHLKPPCNYSLIIHMEGNISSYNVSWYIMLGAGSPRKTEITSSALVWLMKESRGKIVIPKWIRRRY